MPSGIPVRTVQVGKGVGNLMTVGFRCGAGVTVWRAVGVAVGSSTYGLQLVSRAISSHKAKSRMTRIKISLSMFIASFLLVPQVDDHEGGADHDQPIVGP